MTRVVVLALLALLATLTLTSPAAGQSLGLFDEPVRLVERRQGDFSTTGQVTVTFARDDVRGSITYAPAGAGTVSATELATCDGRFRSLGFIASEGQAATTIAQVTRTAPDGTQRRCTDARGERFASGADGPRRQLVVSLPAAGALRTRCGGPTATELGAALPALRLPGDVLPRGNRTLDLRGQRTFAAAGVSGAARSSVVLQLTGVRRQAVGRQPSDEPLLAGFRTLRLERSEGAIALEVAVPDDGAGCQDLDLCGATVTQELSLAGARGEGAVRLGRRSASGYLGVTDARTRTTLRRPDGSQCADALAATPLALDLQPLRGGPIRAALTLADQGAIGLSGCPSPAPADAGVPRLLAVGSVTRSALQRTQVTLRLHGSGAFSGPLGGGRATGELVVVLRRSTDG